jgi:hypothetical protein
MKTFILSVLTVLAFSQAQAAKTSAKIETVAPAPVAVSQTTTRIQNVTTNSFSEVSRAMPHLGLILSSLAGVDGAGSQTKTGFEIGGLVDFGRGRTVFETGILYRQLGSYSVGSFGGNSISAAFEAEYIAVPLNAKFYVSGQKENSLFLKGGIMPGYLVSKKIKGNNSNGSSGTINDVPMSSFDLSIDMGLGGRLITGEKSSILLEATYARGLTNVFETSSNAFNSSFAFTAGFAIDM